MGILDQKPDKREEAKTRAKKWRIENKEKHKAYSRDYYYKHRKDVKAKVKKYNAEHKEKRKVYIKQYGAKHKEERNAYNRLRYEMNPKIRLAGCMSSGIGQSLKNGKAGKSWKSLVSYTLKDLKRHLEKLFQPEMTWNNYGKNGWQVDHKIPISVFNFTKPDHVDFKRCWALSNLQPMWAKENNKKNAKITKHFQPALEM